MHIEIAVKNQNTNFLEDTMIILVDENNLNHLPIKQDILAKYQFTGAYQQTLEFKHLYAKKLILIGLGSVKGLNNKALLHIGGMIANVARKDTAINIELLTQYDNNLAYTKILTGIKLKAWRFTKYLSQQPDNILNHVTLLENPSYPLNHINITEIDAITNSIAFAKELIYEPANILTPEHYVRQLTELNIPNLSISILSTEHLKQLGMDALLSVSKGSAYGSYVAVLEYYGASEDDPLLAFVGKGVTFDTGGYSLKPAMSMLNMKKDMSGSASVVGLMQLLASRNANVNAVGIIGIVDNCVNEVANKPGDIVKSMSGKTIEILNTDAEGRLVLADLLTYTQQYFNPDIIVNLATLTGAIIVALGEERAGLFSNDQTLASQLFNSGENTGELLWHMPISDEYKKHLKSDIADLQNISTTMKGAGSIFAAVFLHEFIENCKWAHLDIAGVANISQANDLNQKGMVAFGVLLLNEFIIQYYEN